ncbi:MAG: DUF6468 domain-containing protein [Pseudomonadota bacterium]
MPVSVFDIAIILISSVACLYCILLSRRLQALQNTRNGLGATIKALSDSISAVSATTDETRYHAGELASRLARLIEEAKTSCTRVEGLIEDLRHTEDRLAVTASSPMAPPAPETVAEDTALPSAERLQEISALMERLKHLTEESVQQAEQASSGLRPLPTQLRSRMKVV